MEEPSATEMAIGEIAVIDVRADRINTRSERLRARLRHAVELVGAITVLLILLVGVATIFAYTIGWCISLSAYIVDTILKAI